MILGLVSFELDEPVQALELLQRASDLEPEIREFAEALAAINARLGRLTDSLFYVKLAAALQPHPRIAKLLPTRYGDYLANVKQGRPDLYRVRAERKLRGADPAGAVADCERQLKLTPGDLPQARPSAPSPPPMRCSMPASRSPTTSAYWPARSAPPAATPRPGPVTLQSQRLPRIAATLPPPESRPSSTTHPPRHRPWRRRTRLGPGAMPTASAGGRRLVDRPTPSGRCGWPISPTPSARVR
jgi:hypothetical protein